MVRGAAVALTLVVCATADVAAADDDAGARARDLFAAAREDVARGDLDAACEKFRQSHAIAPDAVGPLLNVADCDERAGKIASAWQAFQRGASLAGDDEERRDYATRRAATLEPRVPHLTLLFPGDAPPGMRVMREGDVLDRSALEGARAIDPGAHRFVVSAPGHADRTHVVDLGEGQHVTLVLDLGEASPPPGPPIPSKGPPPDRVTPVASSTHPMSATTLAGWIVGGVGLAGLIVGIATGVAVAVNAGIYDEHCDADGRCDPEGLAAASRGEPLAIVSPVALVVGAVGVGIAIPLLLTGSDGAGVALRVWTRGEAGFVGVAGAL